MIGFRVPKHSVSREQEQPVEVVDELGVEKLQDNIVSVSEVVPPLRGLDGAALKEIANQALIPVQVDGDRQYYISLRHGILVEKHALFQLMSGKSIDLKWE